ncbi:hypothetical protein CPB86DRAFT_789846 [Serendipita vermifera]|nr:hypothetical protein CPB86DRAFT_789846 [Serendipita vermifera]
MVEMIIENLDVWPYHEAKWNIQRFISCDRRIYCITLPILYPVDFPHHVPLVKTISVSCDPGFFEEPKASYRKPIQAFILR